MTVAQHLAETKKVLADAIRNDICRAYEQSNKSSISFSCAASEFELLIREIYPLEAADNPVWK